MHTKRGFTLVELSVVLVIIGLLVGGVLAGQTMIRASELRSIATDLNKYNTAINAFREQYDSLPGDMQNATTYWGAANAAANPCKTTNSLGSVATCNGDGNGHITDTMTDNTTNYEAFRAWQQLANAKLITADFSGVSDGGANTRVSKIGENVPQSRIKKAGFNVFFLGTYSAATWVSDTYNHVIVFGAQDGSTDTIAPILLPEEMVNLDSKMDDGLPLVGAIMTRITLGCTTTSVANTAKYALSTRQTDCNVIYKLGY